MVERLIKAGHLRRYVREVNRGTESTPTVDRITIGATTPFESRPAINYILVGPFDDQYQSKHQQKKIMRVAIVKARVNAAHTGGSWEETKPINGLISFPPVNPNKVLVCNAPKIPYNFYNNFIIYSGYKLSQTCVFPEKLVN